MLALFIYYHLRLHTLTCYRVSCSSYLAFIRLWIFYSLHFGSLRELKFSFHRSRSFSFARLFRPCFFHYLFPCMSSFSQSFGLVIYIQYEMHLPPFSILHSPSYPHLIKQIPALWKDLSAWGMEWNGMEWKTRSDERSIKNCDLERKPEIDGEAGEGELELRLSWRMFTQKAEMKLNSRIWEKLAMLCSNDKALKVMILSLTSVFAPSFSSRCRLYQKFCHDCKRRKRRAIPSAEN